MAKVTESPISIQPGDRPKFSLGRRFAPMLAACLAFANRVMNLQSEYKWRSERYRSRMQLLALNDHELRDIGITREDAVEEASRDFWD